MPGGGALRPLRADGRVQLGKKFAEAMLKLVRQKGAGKSK